MDGENQELQIVKGAIHIMKQQHILSVIIKQGCSEVILTGPALEVGVANEVFISYNFFASINVMLSTTFKLCDSK